MEIHPLFPIEGCSCCYGCAKIEEDHKADGLSVANDLFTHLTLFLLLFYNCLNQILYRFERTGDGDLQAFKGKDSAGARRRARFIAKPLISPFYEGVNSKMPINIKTITVIIAIFPPLPFTQPCRGCFSKRLQNRRKQSGVSRKDFPGNEDDILA